MTTIKGSLNDLIPRLLENRKRAGITSPSTRLAQALQLPLWPDQTRGVPNGVLRSALFGAIRKGARKYMDRERIEAQGGTEIFYTGQTLDQGDLDLWENVLHIYSQRKAGEECRFRAVSMLKLLGKTDTGKNRNLLYARLLRLKANGVEVKQGRFSYIGSLIDEAYKDNVTQEYVIVLNAKLQPLFSVDQFTQVQWDVRHALDGKPLAQWLHGFYASHAEPFALKVETLRKLCGSKTVRIDHYRHDLRKALDAVTKASAMYGQPFSYEIQNDLIYVEKKPKKKPSRAQNLARKTINQ
jgi:hypothetical protein